MTNSRTGLLFHLAELEVRAGRLDAALRNAEEGLAIHQGSYAEQAQDIFSYVIALIRAHQGDTGLARQVAEEGLARCEAQVEGLFGAIHRATLGFIEARGREQRGRGRAARGRRRTAPKAPW